MQFHHSNVLQFRQKPRVGKSRKLKEEDSSEGRIGWQSDCCQAVDVQVTRGHGELFRSPVHEWKAQQRSESRKPGSCRHFTKSQAEEAGRSCRNTMVSMGQMEWVQIPKEKRGCTHKGWVGRSSCEDKQSLVHLTRKEADTCKAAGHLQLCQKDTKEWLPELGA